jgi:hypothetical protein
MKRLKWNEKVKMNRKEKELMARLNKVFQEKEVRSIYHDKTCRSILKEYGGWKNLSGMDDRYHESFTIEEGVITSYKKRALVIHALSLKERGRKKVAYGEMTAKELKKYEVSNQKLKRLPKAIGKIKFAKIVKESQTYPYFFIGYGEEWYVVEYKEHDETETIEECWKRANENYWKNKIVNDYLIVKGKWYWLPDISEPTTRELAIKVADSIIEKAFPGQGFGVVEKKKKVA